VSRRLVKLMCFEDAGCRMLRQPFALPELYVSMLCLQLPSHGSCTNLLASTTSWVGSTASGPYLVPQDSSTAAQPSSRPEPAGTAQPTKHKKLDKEVSPSDPQQTETQ
jgi:hypothetical protein